MFSAPAPSPQSPQNTSWWSHVKWTGTVTRVLLTLETAMGGSGSPLIYGSVAFLMKKLVLIFKDASIKDDDSPPRISEVFSLPWLHAVTARDAAAAAPAADAAAAAAAKRMVKQSE